MSLNTIVFYYLYHLVDRLDIFQCAAVFFADYFQYFIVVAAVALLFWPKGQQVRNRVMVVVSLFAALVARVVVKSLILLVVHEPRPFVALTDVYARIATSVGENFQSFPSGHAVFFFALAGAMYCFNKKIGSWFFASALIMGIARVMVGVHWPLDIVGGGVIGTLTGVGCFWLYHRYQTRADEMIDKIFEIVKQ